uniref:Uncharacterized protein n=1 Tax=viral metagenome TaxID=1070528 RepID=A0A6C0B5T8_9ZZZZ
MPSEIINIVGGTTGVKKNPKSLSKEEMEVRVLNRAPLPIDTVIASTNAAAVANGAATAASSTAIAATQVVSQSVFQNLTLKYQMTQSVSGAIRNLRHETIPISKIICEITDNEAGEESWGEAKNVLVEFNPHSIKVSGDGNGYPSVERLLTSHQRGNQHEINNDKDTKVAKTGKFCEGKFSQFAIVDKRTEVTTIDGMFVICKSDVETMKSNNNFNPTVMPRKATPSELEELNINLETSHGTTVILERFVCEYDPQEQYEQFKKIAPHLYKSLGSSTFKTITVVCGEESVVFDNFTDFTAYSGAPISHKFEGEIVLHTTSQGERYNVPYATISSSITRTDKKFGKVPQSSKVDKFSLPFKFTVLASELEHDTVEETGWKFRRNGRNLNILNSHEFGAGGGMYRGKGCRGEINFGVSPILDIVMGVTPLKDIPISKFGSLPKVLRESLKYIGNKGAKLSETIWAESRKCTEAELLDLMDDTNFGSLSLEGLKMRLSILTTIKESKSYKSKTGYRLDGRNGQLKKIISNETLSKTLTQLINNKTTPPAPSPPTPPTPPAPAPPTPPTPPAPPTEHELLVAEIQQTLRDHRVECSNYTDVDLKKIKTFLEQFKFDT